MVPAGSPAVPTAAHWTAPDRLRSGDAEASRCLLATGCAAVLYRVSAHRASLVEGRAFMAYSTESIFPMDLGAPAHQSCDGPARFRCMDADAVKASLVEGRAQLRRCSGQDRERPVVHRYDVLDAEQADRQRRLARPHREVAADRQEGELRGVELTDQRHVPERGRVAREIEAEPVLELDDQADRVP